MDWDFVRSTWTLWIVPAAAAIAGFAFFLKTALEVRKLRLETQKLKTPVVPRLIHVPSDTEIFRYGVTTIAVRRTVRRTVRLSGVLLAAALPVSLYFWSQRIDQPPAVPPLSAEAQERLRQERLKEQLAQEERQEQAAQLAMRQAERERIAAARRTERDRTAAEQALALERLGQDAAAQSAASAALSLDQSRGALGALDRYQEAHRWKTLGALLAIYPSLNREAQQSFERMSADCFVYSVTFRDVRFPRDAVVADDRVVLTASSSYACIPKPGETAVTTSVQQTFLLRRVGGEWLIENVSPGAPGIP